jgi:YVTN family beta-propeller protein
LAYDGVEGEVFVTDGMSGGASARVTVISDATNAVVATIQVGDSPVGIAYDSGNGHVYVSNLGQGTVSIISLSGPAVTSFAASPQTVSIMGRTNFTAVVSRGARPLTYAYTGLPPGCSSSNTSMLPCRPTSAGTYNVTLQVTDPDGRIARASTTLLVNSATISGLQPEVFFIEIGVAIAVAVAVVLFGIRRKKRQQMR